MGLLDILGQGNSDGGQWSDVPIGYRLGLLGNILASAAQGQAPSPAGFAIMAKMKQDASDQRKAAKQMELASKYLDKRPDLKPLVESGAVSIADIIKMDREDATKADQRKYDRERFLFEEDYKTKNDPDAIWRQQFFGGGGTPTPAPTGVETITPPVPPSPAQEAAALEAQISGVPTPPAPPAPAMPPVPGGETNNPVTQKLRVILKDPNLDDQEAAFIASTVKNQDDLRAAYDTILRNRTERRKVQLEEQKAADAKTEAEQKKADSKAAEQRTMMTTITSIDTMLGTLDAEGLPTVGVGYLFQHVPTTNAGKFRASLDQLRNAIGFEKLQELRANSSSGASGLGQVSNYEQRMLGSSEGAIDQSLDEDTMRETLKQIRAKMIAFNTPSKEDPTKSVLTMDSERLAKNPTPENISMFERKYGVGSSSVITGDTTPANERPGEEDPTALDPEQEAIVQEYFNRQGAQ